MKGGERRRAADRHERSAAASLGASLHRGSGSGSKRNDSHTAQFLIENKTVLSGNRQITVKADVLRQLSREAGAQGRDPLLHIRVDGEDWVVIPEYVFVSLLDN